MVRNWETEPASLHRHGTRSLPPSVVIVRQCPWPICLWMIDCGCVPIGIEGIVCATQHRAAICGMLPREVEVCIVPNAGWKMHLNVRLQSSIMTSGFL